VTFVGVVEDELEQLTSALKSHEEAIGELESRHDPALEARIEELREQRVELIARLGALGRSGSNGDAD
jgi:chromosome segregation ATPase